MTYKVSEKTFLICILSFFLIGFIIVLNRPITLSNDSEGYLNMSIIRSASYPIFLDFIHSFFGSFFKIATLIIQYFLGISAIYYFISTLKRHIKLDLIWLIILNFVLLVPYIYNHKLANVFLSEALAYPLYLITISLFIKSISLLKTRPLIIALPILLILIETRSQFLFLIPIAIGILIWFWYEKKILKHKWLFILLILFPLITNITDKCYHKLKHNHYTATPWTGIHLLTPAFFVADSEDYTIYKSKIEQDFFKQTYKALANKHLNNHEFKSNTTNEITTYVGHYSEIANHTILPVGLKFVDSLKTTNEKLIEVDKVTKRMSIPLILNNFKPWIKLYFKNFTYGFGNAKYTLLLFILLIYSLIKSITTKHLTYKIILLASLLCILNMALIALGMHTLKRFTFYNDWALFLILFLLINYKTTKQTQ